MNVLIAAGGTGGHIYPALAVAKALMQKHPNAQVHFVGTALGLETELVPREGFALHTLSIGRLNRNVGWWERLKTVLQLPWSFVQSARLIGRLKPEWVLGVGGHASGPLLLTAAVLRRRTFIWEPNAYPGLANRWLSRFVGECLVVFKEASRYLKNKKVRQVGLPVRAEIENLHAKPQTPPRRPLRILVFGGSQGARPLNTLVAEALSDNHWQGRVQVVHQTGKGDWDRVLKLYASKPAWVEPLAYLHDMEARLAWADLVVGRSGTGTLSELAAAQKPALLVPLPTAADNHQQKNAELFVKAGAARMILQKDLTASVLTRQLESFLQDPKELESMAAAVGQFFTPHAAQEIVAILAGH